jgi:hypothetical protein
MVFTPLASQIAFTVSSFTMKVGFSVLMALPWRVIGIFFIYLSFRCSVHFEYFNSGILYLNAIIQDLNSPFIHFSNLVVVIDFDAKKHECGDDDGDDDGYAE